MSFITEISIVIPIEIHRVGLFSNSYAMYNRFGFPIDYEFIFISRTLNKPPLPNFKLINYEFYGSYFNPSMALNLGVKNSKYSNVLVTSPEVMPLTPVFDKLKTFNRGNYLCRVFDQNPDGSTGKDVVNKKGGNNINKPSMYFLAVFKKEDIEAINGWDEDFMKGFAWEDTDFGNRFNRAGLTFSIINDIVGLHQWHERNYNIEGWNINKKIMELNNKNNIIKCKNGLIKY